MQTYFAHVKWFVEEDQQSAAALSSFEWALVVIGILFGTLLLWFVHKLLIRFGITQRLDDALSKYSKAIIYIVRYTTGILLLINAARGLLFAPNVPVSSHEFAPALSLLMGAAGILLIIGVKIRWAATVILAVYVLSLAFVRPVIDVLDHLEYIGIGLYLLLHGYKPLEAYAKRKGLQSVLTPESLLRIFVGLGLMVLALSEKLVGVGLSTDFLQHHQWNFLQVVGVSDRVFIIISGITEFVVGLTLVLNIAPRLTTAIVALLMTITAILLGIEEVFGHLFALSLVAVVWLRREQPEKPARKRTGARKRK